MPLRPGETVGNYVVVARIGGGGTAAVFEVTHVNLGTRHALKVLLPQMVQDATLRARFLQEGQLQATFTHAGLVRVTDTVAEPGVAGLVMELLEGETLRDRLEREGHVAPKEAVQWIRAAAEALQEAHDQGIIHRDLKPENLFLQRTAAGDVMRILDFGIAKGPGSQRTTQRGALGTCAYMSPEQVRDPSAVDLRTDVFALGTVLWEMLTGKPAFEGKTPFDSMERVLKLEFTAPSTVRSNIPGWLDDVVEVAMKKSPDSRFADAQALATALEAGPRGGALPVVQASAAPTRRRSSFPLWVLALILGPLAFGGLLILVVFGLAVYFEPPRVKSFTVVSDSCGLVTIDAVAKGRTGAVELRVNGAVVQSLPVKGETPIHHQLELPMASVVTVDVRAGKDLESDVHVVAGTPMSVVIQGQHGQREGAVARTPVKIEGTCIPAGLTYETLVNGVTTEGALPSSNQLLLDTRGLETGRHALEVRVLDGDTSVADTTFVLAVGDKPPPDDQDMDGYVTIVNGGPDCDDQDPNVNPGMEERPNPNGIDDNCDGRVDEGTVAFDDDGDGLSEQEGDCNDDDPSVRPGASELPDCRDQDCDDEIDEGITLPERDDLYEPNDSRAKAYDLRTGSKRRFSSRLELVASSTKDEAWFRFYSQDGDFDQWGIDVSVPQLPANSAVLLEVFDDGGTPRGSLLVGNETDQLEIRGRSFHNDSGDYWLRVSPTQLYADWCPVVVKVVAR